MRRYSYETCEHTKKEVKWSYGTFYYNDKLSKVGTKRVGEIYCKVCGKYLYTKCDDFVPIEVIRNEAIDRYYRELRANE